MHLVLVCHLYGGDLYSGVHSPWKNTVLGHRFSMATFLLVFLQEKVLNNNSIALKMKILLSSFAFMIHSLYH